jgi:hypothetical protein
VVTVRSRGTSTLLGGLAGGAGTGGPLTGASGCSPGEVAGGCSGGGLTGGVGSCPSGGVFGASVTCEALSGSSWLFPTKANGDDYRRHAS